MPVLSNLFLRFSVWREAHRREIAAALFAFVISSTSFGLGYLANRELVRTPIIIEKCSDGQ